MKVTTTVFEFIQDSLHRILIEDLNTFKSNEDAKRLLRDTVHNSVITIIIPNINVKFIRDNWNRVVRNIDRSVEKITNAQSFVIFGKEKENEIKNGAIDQVFIILKILQYIKDNDIQAVEKITDLLIESDPQIKNIIKKVVYELNPNQINEYFKQWNYNVVENIKKYAILINDLMDITKKGKEDAENEY